MKKLHFIMSHAATADQLNAAREAGYEPVEWADKKAFVVPDQVDLGRDWFLERARNIGETFTAGDAVHPMGQPQLVDALKAEARRRGCAVIESVTPREVKETPQPDGTVKKEAIFVFRGFREVHQY